MQVVAPGIALVPVRTPTLPPATHTNTWIVGEGELSVFDPASPYEDQQAMLAGALEERLSAGERLARIVLTHHHHDHVAGAVALKRRFGGEVPIVAHPTTARLLERRVPVDAAWEDRQAMDCGGRTLVAMHTPGHAPGHLVFHDEESGAMIAGDMVAGIGTIVIDPADGDLGDYLASLERMRRASPGVLLPAHGPALHQADALLAFYVAHRHQRTEQIRQALDRRGTGTPAELVSDVYPDLDPRARDLAAGQIRSHLRWMALHGLADDLGGEATWALVR